MKKFMLSASILLSFFLIACDSEKRISREVFDEVQKANEVKKINEADILNEGLEWGNQISKEAQEQLMVTLQSAIEEHGIPGAVEFCNVKALPILKKVGDQHGVVIRRASNAYRNPADRPDQDEKDVMLAYENNEENGIKNKPNIEKVASGKVLLYTKAITIPGGLCLNCHGEPGKEISVETLNKINQLYPEDKATGHKIGDLRGMWSIALPEKEIVNRL